MHQTGPQACLESRRFPEGQRVRPQYTRKPRAGALRPAGDEAVYDSRRRLTGSRSPPRSLTVTEHQAEVKAGPTCHHHATGIFPADGVAPVPYGPRVLVFIHGPPSLSNDPGRSHSSAVFRVVGPGAEWTDARRASVNGWSRYGSPFARRYAKRRASMGMKPDCGSKDA